MTGGSAGYLPEESASRSAASSDDSSASVTASCGAMLLDVAEMGRVNHPTATMQRLLARAGWPIRKGLRSRQLRSHGRRQCFAGKMSKATHANPERVFRGAKANPQRRS